MQKHCPLCGQRVSEWWITSGKTTTVGKFTVHNSCLQDLELRRGQLTVAEIMDELKDGG